LELRTSLKHWKKEHQLILEKIYNLTLIEGNIKQQQKFALLSKLFKDLCSSRNSKSKFKNITSLIILLLNLYKINYPLDKYSKMEENTHQLNEKSKVEFKKILCKEFLL
jgi:hypothetical protein